MQTIELETYVAAPPERCFYLSLSIDLHVESASSTQERAIGGVTSGIIGLGENVVWVGKHFGLWLNHESTISGYDSPRYFQDKMTRGHFRTFEHDHFFEPRGEGTLMRDVMRFASPLGLLGRAVDTAILRHHLRAFLRERNNVIRSVAESPHDWQRFLGTKAVTSQRQRLA